MKKIIFTIVFLFPFISFSQSTTQNYIKTTTYKVPYQGAVGTIDTSGVIIPITPINDNDKTVQLTYYDGLGRPMQQIAHKQSSLGKDIIVHIEYDSLGRQSKDYLPYVNQTSSLNYIGHPVNDLLNFYANPTLTSTGNPNFEATNFPYSEKLFENSPLNRVLKQAAPGSVWSLPTNSGSPDHTIKFDFQTNIFNEVRKFKVVFPITTTEMHHLETDGFYSVNQLYKTVTKDENWTSADGHDKTTQEFKDKQGHVVLKRTFNGGFAHNTYYVYDIYGNLSYVIPPTASDAIDTEYNTSANVNRNYPWTKLAEINEELAQEYDRLFSDYNNELILDSDLFNQYGGQGGFSLATNSNNELILSINISTLEPMELRKGEIFSLQEIGNFNDSELGRIIGDGYEYVFTIKDNFLSVIGEGKVSSLNVTFTGNTMLVYNTNYPWAYMVDIEPAKAEEYISVYNEMENKTILSSNVKNDYGASGGANIIIDENDVVSLNLNITAITPLNLKTGIVIPLNTERRIIDRNMGTIEGNGFKYFLSIKENSLFIEGEGSFTNINQMVSFEAPVDISFPQDIREGLCYEYRYDNRNRLVEKRIPGKGWEYIVYDKLDRPVLTQDANLRLQNRWLFTKYDAFNRVVYAGQFKFVSTSGNVNTTLRLELQGLANNNMVLNEAKAIATFENGGIKINYTNVIFPSSINNEFTVFTVNYYDDYDFQPYGLNYTLPTTVYSTTANILTNVKTLPTGSFVRVLDKEDWIINLTAYDSKARPIWSRSQNSYLKTDDVTQIHLDFIGKTIETTSIHNKIGVTTNLVTIDKFTYDHADRLLKQIQTVGSHPEELIAFNQYDELGTLIQKKVGGIAPTALQTYASVTTALQTIDYSYNIRGWLKNINNPDQNLTDDLFAFKINYNTPQLGAIALYNGNISETSWRSKNDDKTRNYKYSYDALNRLAQADYVGNYALINNATQFENYGEGNIQYDKNGNITHLERFGLKSSTPTIDKIDNLNYLYEPKSNKLKQVIDIADSAGFKDGNNTGIDYTYDINGNMTTDANKGITSITYNHLNLPKEINFSFTEDPNTLNSGKIVYLYDATGRKLSKEVFRSGLITNYAPKLTQYAGNYIYEGVSSNMTLQFFSHPEGYVANDNNNYSYIYQYKDHLGNVRLSYKDVSLTTTPSLKIVEENNYYPFGLKHQGYNSVITSTNTALKYKYNGKELQDELGLNVYDYGARLYDPSRAGWSNIDPKAETSRRWSPYNYCYNNPMRFTDPDGMQADDIIIKGKDAQKALSELQKSVGSDFALNMDGDGKVSYTSNVKSGPLSEGASRVAQMVDDHTITVNVNAENTKSTSDCAQLLGGAFMGNSISKDPLTNTNMVSANQEVNPYVLESISNYYGKPGADMLHEVTESYEGGKIAQKTGYETPSTRKPRGRGVYQFAHKAATSQSGDVYADNKDSSGNNTGDDLNDTGTANYFVQEGNRPPVVIQTYP